MHSEIPKVSHWRIVAATVVIVLSTFANVGDWRASLISIDRLNQFQERELRTADSLQGTNLNSAISYLLLGGFGVIAVLFSRDQSSNRINAFALVIIAFFAWCGLSTIWSPDVVVGMRKFTSYVLLLIGAIGLTRFCTLDELIWVAIASTVVMISAGLMTELAIGTFRPFANNYRFSGLVHANIQSFYGVVLCIAAACRRRPESHRFDTLGMALIVAGLTCIWLTKSRSSLGGLIVVAMVVGFVAVRGWRKGLLVGLVGSAAASVMMVLSMVPSTTLRGFLGFAAMGRGDNAQSLTGRVPLWSELLLAVGDRPLLGYGFGSFWSAKRVTYYSEIFLWEIPNAHSIYLDSVLQYGLIGSGLFLSMLLIGLAIAATRYWNRNERFALFPIAIIIFAFVHGVTESEFVEKGFGAIWLMVCLIILATSKRPSDKNLQRPEPLMQTAVPQ